MAEDLKVQIERAEEVWNTLQAKGDVIYLGTASCGIAAGIRQVSEAITEHLSTGDRDVELVEVGCIGMCCFEPMIYVQTGAKAPVVYGGLEPKDIPKLLDGVYGGDYENDHLLGVIGDGFDGLQSIYDHPMVAPQKRIITENAGLSDPVDIDHYLARGGFKGLERALSMTPDEVVDEVLRSGLRGRGGAGFPTGRKWALCRAAEGAPKYMICNADEGDPGAFMDRSILEGDPYRVIEGMIIAGYAIGCDEGIFYVRAEYPLAIERLEICMAEAEKRGFLGNNILGTDFSHQLTIKKGAGAFVCGEETALMASIEGKRGMPRPRPPFPAQKGLWGKPTNINNVKSVSSVPSILRAGADWYAAVGTDSTTGTAVFCITGKINHTGLIEVPMGITLKEIVEDIGGGVANGRSFKAVQTGGPSGGCLPADKLDLTVDFESLTAAGAIMGSGGMVVMDDENCMVDVAKFFISFTQYESCGKCPPCRIGTKKMKDLLEKITVGKGEDGDLETLERLASTVKAGSLCALGGTAPNPVLSTIRYFRDEYEAHIKDKVCPAKACRELIAYTIDAEKCTGCTLCARNCPTSCIEGETKEAHVIDTDACVKCGMCITSCRFDAVHKIDSPPSQCADEGQGGGD